MTGTTQRARSEPALAVCGLDDGDGYAEKRLLFSGLIVTDQVVRQLQAMPCEVMEFRQTGLRCQVPSSVTLDHETAGDVQGVVLIVRVEESATAIGPALAQLDQQRIAVHADAHVRTGDAAPTAYSRSASTSPRDPGWVGRLRSAHDGSRRRPRSDCLAS